MLKKIKQWFSKQEQSYVSCLDFRTGIKALGIETYKDINVFYLTKPNKDTSDDQPIYHFFYKKEFYSEEGESLDDLKRLAHNKIDEIK